MSHKDIIKILNTKALKTRLQRAGITHLRLFGSAARDEMTDDSDIDLLYEFNANNIKDDRGVRGAYTDLTEQLGHPVELIQKDKLNHTIQSNVFNSMISVF